MGTGKIRNSEELFEVMDKNGFDKTDCIKTICLYLKEYLTDEQFEDLFSAQITAFQSYLEEDIYLDIVFANFHSKEERLSLKTKLYQYVLQNNENLYKNTNDASVERMIEADPEDKLVQILRKKYEKKAEICIDCSGIRTSSELICTIKQSLQFPGFCGPSWDAVEDLICDVILPKRLSFSHWDEMERNLPKDTKRLKMLLEQYIADLCVITYK